MFTTYIYPHIEDHLRRWMEKNLGCIPLSKHMMKQVRQIQKLYHAEGLDTADIAKQLGMPESKVVQRLNYNTHSISLDEMLDNDALPLSDGTFLYGDNIAILNTAIDPVDWTVLMKIWLSLLTKVIEQLEERNKYILGHFFGVYGYERKTLDELAFEEMLTLNGIYKAKEASLQRLREIYYNSDLYIWHKAYIMTKLAAQRESESPAASPAVFFDYCVPNLDTFNSFNFFFCKVLSPKQKNRPVEGVQFRASTGRVF